MRQTHSGLGRLRGNPQNLADFPVTQLGVDPQHHRLSQLRRHALQRFPDTLLPPTQLQRLIRRWILRVLQPISQPLVQRKSRQPLAPSFIAAAADRNLAQPCSEARSLRIIVGQFPESVLKRILHHLFGIFSLLQQIVGEPVDVIGVAFIKRRIRSFLAGQATANQPPFWGFFPTGLPGRPACPGLF